MLVLTRRPSESIIIANNIKITVVSVGPGRVKLGIEAPSNVRVDRQEIHDKIEQSADVLDAVVGTTASADTQNTLVTGPDTAMIVGGTPPAALPAPPTPGGSASPPPLPLNRSRLPRKPR